MSTIFFVKFADIGYYATKQPHYEWSFTHELKEANRYKTRKAATERGEWGVRLSNQHLKYPTQKDHFVTPSYEIEEYNVEEILTRINHATK